ncbi:MAG: GxxExxY protein [Candidatus Cloacimonadales bacterium]
MISNNLLYKDECYKIQGAIFNVYKELGCGFLESVYQEALEIELSGLDIPFESQKEIKISYHGTELKRTFVADIVCYNKIILELKSIKELVGVNRAQILNYLKATNLRVGLLVNFGTHPKVQIERFVL